MKGLLKLLQARMRVSKWDYILEGNKFSQRQQSVLTATVISPTFFTDIKVLCVGTRHPSHSRNGERRARLDFWVLTLT